MALRGTPLNWWSTEQNWVGSPGLPPPAVEAVRAARDKVAKNAELGFDTATLFAAVKSRAAQKRPVAHVAKLAPGQAPVIDGDLADPAWQEAPWLSPFLPVLAWRQDPQMTTTAKIRWDDQALYVAFRCQEDRPGGLRTQIAKQDDYFLLGDDNVQILIAGRGEKTIVYRFVANSRQVTYDALCREHPDEYARKWDPFVLDLNYTSGWQCAAQVGAEAWTVEAMIPWQALDLPTPTVGAELSLNLGRYRTQAMGERTYWAPVLEMQGDFLERMEPDLFGTVVLE